jgi:hypothetical protein
MQKLPHRFFSSTLGLNKLLETHKMGATADACAKRFKAQKGEGGLLWSAKDGDVGT